MSSRYTTEMMPGLDVKLKKFIKDNVEPQSLDLDKKPFQFLTADIVLALESTDHEDKFPGMLEMFEQRLNEEVIVIEL